MLEAETRQVAISELLDLLGTSMDQVRVDPSRTLLQFGEQLWTIVGVSSASAEESASLRRGGAKHKQVR